VRPSFKNIALTYFSTADSERWGFDAMAALVVPCEKRSQPAILCAAEAAPLAHAHQIVESDLEASS
jgi:hypothetical protein